MTQTQDSKSLDKEIIRVQKSTRSVWNWSVRVHNFLRMRFSWYWRWHTHPWSRPVHYSVLALALLAFVALTLIVLISWWLFKYLAWLDSFL